MLIYGQTINEINKYLELNLKYLSYYYVLCKYLLILFM